MLKRLGSAGALFACRRRASPRTPTRSPRPPTPARGRCARRSSTPTRTPAPTRSRSTSSARGVQTIAPATPLPTRSPRPSRSTATRSRAPRPTRTRWARVSTRSCRSRSTARRRRATASMVSAPNVTIRGTRDQPLFRVPDRRVRRRGPQHLVIEGCFIGIYAGRAPQLPGRRRQRHRGDEPRLPRRRPDPRRAQPDLRCSAIACAGRVRRRPGATSSAPTRPVCALPAGDARHRQGRVRSTTANRSRSEEPIPTRANVVGRLRRGHQDRDDERDDPGQFLRRRRGADRGDPERLDRDRGHLHRRRRQRQHDRRDRRRARAT